MANQQDQAGQCLFDAKLTQQYRLASPVGGKMIAPLCDSLGLLHVFSLGSDGHLYDIRQDQTSDTGWTSNDMNFNGSIASVAAGIESDGTTIVFAADTGANFYYIRDVRWNSAWHCFENTNEPGAVDIRLGRDKSGDLLFTASTVDPSERAWNSLRTYDYTQVNAPASPIGNPYDSDGNRLVFRLDDYQIGPDRSSTAANGLSTYLIGFARHNSNDSPTLAGKKTPWTSGPDDFWAWNDPFGFSRLALAQSPTDSEDSAIFVIRWLDNQQKSNGLYYFDPVAKTLVALSAGVNLTEIKADLDAQGRLSLMALGQDGHLYHVHQDSKSPSGWTDMVSLNDQLTFTTMATVKDRDGNMVAFAADAAFNLYQVWQDPATQDWQFERVEAGKGPLEEINAYSTQITVFDANGAPRTDAEVEIWSSGPTPAAVNDQNVALDANSPVRARTNAAGRITVVVPADGLHTPTLTVKTPFMGVEEGTVIEPNYDVQTKLRALTAHDLLQAEDADRQPITLLTGDFNNLDVAQAVADAINQTMLMMGPGDDPARSAAARRYVHPRTRTAGVRTVSARDPAATARIDLSSVPDASWKIDFSGPRPVFTKLSSGEASRLMAQRRATLPAAADGFGYDVDWGDVWNSFTDSVAEIVDVVVNAVVNAANTLVTEIQAQITLLIDNVRHVFDATIDFVEQVFDVVVGVFEKVAVDFKKLFDWLAYVFDWQDINRTAEVVTYIFNTSLDFLLVAATKAKAAVDGKFDEFATFMNTGMDDFIASFSGTQTIGEALNPTLPPAPAFESRASHNVLMDAFLNNQARAQPPSRAKVLMATATSDALQPILEELTDLESTFEGSSALRDAVRYLEAIRDNPDQLLTLGLKGLLEIVKAIAQLAIQGLKALVDLIFDAMAAVIDALKTVLNEDWSIPLVSEIYEMATGKAGTFKPLDLFAVIVAIPTTSIYKVAKGVAPYPDKAAVDELTQNFTVAWLEQRAWGPAAPAIAAGAEPEPWLTKLRTASVFLFSINFGARAPVEMNINAVEVPPPGLGLFNLVQRFASSVFSIPWVMDDSPEATEWVIWLSQLINGPTRGAVIRWRDDPGSTLGDVTLTLWGAGHLVQVALLADLERRKNKYNAIKTAENILSCLAPQGLKVARLIKGPAGPPIRAAYAIITGLSEGTIALLHLEKLPLTPNERARIGMSAPQAQAALAPA